MNAELTLGKSNEKHMAKRRGTQTANSSQAGRWNMGGFQNF